MTPRLRSEIAVMAAVLATSLPAPSQDDLRDTVVRKDGKELRGRVLDPHTTPDLLLLQGGKRVHVPQTEIGSMRTVAEAVLEFTDRRVKLRDNPRGQWILVEWAASRGLQGLARAQAMHIVLRDDDDQKAHEFLGHKKGPRGWIWEYDGRGLLREQLEAALRKKPLEITGERFKVRCHDDLAGCTAALLDLERMGAFWYAEYGKDLGLQEILTPLLVDVHGSQEPFPRWGFRPLAYYVPPPHGDVAHTMFSVPDLARPQRLFFVGTQALLYRALIGEVSLQSDRERVCPWLEIGLGMLAETTMQGPAGFAAPGPPRLRDMQALQALNLDYKLTNLLHLPMYGGFYLMDDTPTATNWDAAAMLVAFLLNPDNKPATRARFLMFVRLALGERKGDSSSVFDQAMGRRIEELETPFRTWLEKVAGG